MKPGLENIANYWPTFNVTFLWKVIKKIITQKMVWYLEARDLMPKFQPGFRKELSIGLLRLNSDICDTIDSGRVMMLS